VAADLGVCLLALWRPSFSRMFSGGLVLPRDQMDRCDATSILDRADRLPASADSQLHLSECRPFYQRLDSTHWFGGGSPDGFEPRALAVRTLLHDGSTR
jgi:hypothetical protein